MSQSSPKKPLLLVTDGLSATSEKTTISFMASHSSTAPTAHRFTRDEYYRMAQAGLFREERVELLDGEIITMSPKLTPHAYAVNQLMYTLMAGFGASAIVRVQDPIVLNNWSEPEPDIAVCSPILDRYKHAHPRADQVLLVVEVAESSLTYDRIRKTRAYAASGIVEYWIVNLIDQRIEVFTDPDPRSHNYRQRRDVGAGESLPLPNGNTIAVADILP